MVGTVRILLVISEVLFAMDDFCDEKKLEHKKNGRVMSKISDVSKARQFDAA